MWIQRKGGDRVFCNDVICMAAIDAWDRRRRPRGPPLSSLPSDLVVLLLETLAPIDRCAMGATCSWWHAQAQVPLIRNLRLWGSRTFPSPGVHERFPWPVDAFALQCVLHAPRFDRVRTLHLIIDTPALAAHAMYAGERRIGTRRFAQLNTLRSLSVECMRNNTPSAICIGRLIYAARNLTELTLCHLPNVGMAHLHAIGHCATLRKLEIVQCRIAPNCGALESLLTGEAFSRCPLETLQVTLRGSVWHVRRHITSMPLVPILGKVHSGLRALHLDGESFEMLTAAHLWRIVAQFQLLREFTSGAVLARALCSAMRTMIPEPNIQVFVSV